MEVQGEGSDEDEEIRLPKTITVGGSSIVGSTGAVVGAGARLWVGGGVGGMNASVEEGSESE